MVNTYKHIQTHTHDMTHTHDTHMTHMTHMTLVHAKPNRKTHTAHTHHTHAHHLPTFNQALIYVSPSTGIDWCMIRCMHTHPTHDAPVIPVTSDPPPVTTPYRERYLPLCNLTTCGQRNENSHAAHRWIALAMARRWMPGMMLLSHCVREPDGWK